MIIKFNSALWPNVDIIKDDNNHKLSKKIVLTILYIKGLDSIVIM